MLYQAVILCCPIFHLVLSPVGYAFLSIQFFPIPKCACFTVYFSPPRAGSMDLVDWNPFAEDTFSELTEDAIFGREFDRIKSGSRSSEFISNCVVDYCI